MLKAIEQGDVYLLLGLLALYIGALGNCTAIYLNNQKMPVKGLEEATSLHAPIGQNTRVVFLSDIIPFNFKIVSGHVSIGDLLIVSGFITALITMIAFSP
jgi:hypothetical protein